MTVINVRFLINRAIDNLETFQTTRQIRIGYMQNMRSGVKNHNTAFNVSRCKYVRARVGCNRDRNSLRDRPDHLTQT